MGYFISIKMAVLVFSILAFVFTVPYMIFNYRKYGSVNKLRTLIVYSFILYLLTIYFLVILPLPKLENVHTKYTDMLNLMPFSFIADFIKKTPFVITKPATWILALKDSTFYVPVFNVLMFIPFGIYLRYYFKCSFKKTVLLTALLSLFFELTQLSGLYFIYPGPYRLCDIDDIIQNTTGGCIGYALAFIAMKLLPSREEIDDKAIEDGSRVSAIRVCLSIFIDTFILRIIYGLIGNKFLFDILAICYYSLVPLMNGKTIGSALLKFRLNFKDKKYIRMIARGVLLVTYFSLIPYALINLMNQFNKGTDSLLLLCLYVITFFVYIIFIVNMIIRVIRNKYFIFDNISGSIYVSDINKKI